MRIIRSGALPTIVILVCVGCAERQAKRMAQTTITSLAHTLNATDGIVDPLFASAAVDARERVVREREWDRSITLEQGMDRYRELMESWYLLMESLVLSRRLLLIGQDALNIWYSTGELPNKWNQFCDGIGGAFVNMMGLLNEVGVDTPEEIAPLIPHVDTMCNMATAFVMAQSD